MLVIVNTDAMHCSVLETRKYDQEIPQSQTADEPVASWGGATQQSWDTRKTNKAKQPALFLSLPNQDDCKTRMDRKKCTNIYKLEQLQNATMGTHWLKLYVRAVIESEAWPTIVQLKRKPYLITVIGFTTRHADCRRIVISNFL